MRSIKFVLKTVFYALLIFFILVFISHRVLLHFESRNLPPIGKLVEVDGKEMSVYYEGEGDKTLVFLSGSGTTSPILDFKSLYSNLSDNYKIVVIEKFGYGYSYETKGKRDVDTILEESRLALEKLNIKGPYVLVPHSMSGIQALYWAQKYPEEVESIIGLDMSLPDSYSDLEIDSKLLNLIYASSKSGIIRIIPKISQSEAIKYGTLTEEEKAIYEDLFYKQTMNRTMVNEMMEIKSSAEKVKSKEYPNIPYLLFVSNGEGTGFSKEEWDQFQKDFAETNNQVQMIELDSPHYLHNHEYERISREIRDFLGEWYLNYYFKYLNKGGF